MTINIQIIATLDNSFEVSQEIKYKNYHVPQQLYFEKSTQKNPTELHTLK